MSQPLQVHDLHVELGGKHIVDGLTATAPAGGVTMLVGPSGAGKSTVLKAIAGLHHSTGQVRIGERGVAGPTHQRGIGLVFQEPRLFPFLNVRQNVGFAVGDDADRVQTCLDLCRAGHLADRAVEGLSGGERQRVALARALAPAPEVLLLDEPWSALDAVLRAEVAQELLAAVRESATTAVVVTHDRQEALSLADHLWLLDEGRLLQAGAPAEVYRAPKTVHAARLLGPVAAIPVDEDGTVEGRAVGTVAPDDSGRRHALFRPEDLLVSSEGWSVTVTTASFQGSRWLLRGLLAGVEVGFYAAGPVSGPVRLALRVP